VGVFSYPASVTGRNVKFWLPKPKMVRNVPLRRQCTMHKLMYVNVLANTDRKADEILEQVGEIRGFSG
jgi:hypothetical protein